MYSLLHYNKMNLADGSCNGGDFLSDALDPDFYHIYDVLFVPLRVAENTLMSLSVDNDIDSSVNILEFCADNLPKEKELLSILERPSPVLKSSTSSQQSLRLEKIRIDLSN